MGLTELKAAAPRGVSGNNKGGIDFAVASTAILDRLLQQNLPSADVSSRSIVRLRACAITASRSWQRS
jgi:hypothetical protein